MPQDSYQISVGESKSLPIIITPQEAQHISLDWKSENNEIATVYYGNVTGISPGKVKIYATTTDGSNLEAECAVVVSELGGIEDVLVDKSVYVKIFNLHGVLVYEGVYSDAKLLPDYYIVVCGGKSTKVKVK